MSSTAKTIAKQSLVYVSLGFLPVAANLVIAPIFTRYLSKEEYAILAIAAIFQGYISVLLHLGFSGAFSRFFFKYYTKPKLYKALYSTTLIFILGFSSILGTILYLFGDKIFKVFFENSDIFTFSKYGFVVYATAVLVIFQTISLALYRNSEQIKPYAIIAVLAFVGMSAGSIIGVVIYKAGAYGSLLGKLVGLSLVIIPYLLFFFIKNKPILRFSFIKEMFSYALPLVPYALLGTVLTYLDKQLGERFLSLNELGFYNVAFLIASVPSIFIFAAQSTINPSVFKGLEKYKLTKNKSELKDIKTLFTYFFIFILVIFSVLIALIVPASNLILGEEYKSVSHYIPLLSIAYIFRAYYVIYSIPIFFENKTKLLPIINLVAVVIAFSIGYIIIPIYGLTGLCLTFITVMGTQLALAYYFTRRMKWKEAVVFNLKKFHAVFLFLIVLISASYFVLNSTLSLKAWFLNLVVVSLSLLLALWLWKQQFSKAISTLKSKINFN
jgi:O-antigen/teichoic acid export membrane protein